MAHVHNVLEALQEAASGGQGGDSMTVSGLDSVLIDASQVDLAGTTIELSAATVTLDSTDCTISAASRVDLQGGIVDINTGAGTGVSVVGNDVTIGGTGDSVIIATATGQVGFFGASEVAQQSAPKAVASDTISGATAGDASVLKSLSSSVNDIKAALSNLGLTA